MSDQTVTHSTFAIERRYPAAPDAVFAAFADKERKRRWYVEDRSVEQFDMDFRVGGTDIARVRMGEATPFPGTELVYRTTYQDIVPDRRIVYAYSLTFAGKIVSASLVTFEFLPVDSGTDVLFTEQGAYWEGSGGPQMREQGWRALLEKLGVSLAE